MVPGIIAECKRSFIKPEFSTNIPSDLRKSGEILSNEVDKAEPLKKALNMKRVDIIAMLREANLKGRGGAGFPTSTKWQIAAAAKGDNKHVVCNADEGEPGTFKDRYLLDKYIELLLDGMTIGAYTIGAKKGFIYLRGEYLYLLNHIESVIKIRKLEGLLGKSILGNPDFDFNLEIRLGSGAYICGEETALIESLEGNRGEPRNRPPFPVNTGFMGNPTIVNNVETFINTALICYRGTDWFKKIGTERSTGSKIFSISGDCSRPGIYEFPFGISINELLKEAGGEGAKAVQIGGASGSCIPSKNFDRKISFEDVSTGGSVIIFNQSRDMLDVAEDFMEFFVEESCGQCTPCRDGNVRLLEGIHLLKEGKCSITKLNELIKLGETMQLASKCGLGQSSPNAFISIVNNFKDEILGRVTHK